MVAMIHDALRDNGRAVSIVAATLIALACGTNYAYSAWAPQFAQRLRLSSTESNLIGAFGNIGMYACGLPAGILIDAKGPRWGLVAGTIAFVLGYYPIHKAYDAGPGSASVPVLCFFSLFTGIGSASAFSASMKTAALNYPLSRGTSTAFPLSAFGLSAFIFAMTGAFILRDDTSKLLLLLAAGTVILPAASFFFLRVYPPPRYSSVPTHAPSDSRRSRPFRSQAPASAQHSTLDVAEEDFNHEATFAIDDEEDNLEDETDSGKPSGLARGSHESSALIGDANASTASNRLRRKVTDLSEHDHGSPHVDIRGFALLPRAEFWQLFLMLGLLTGIGLMTINNIGNDAQALWKFHDPTVDDAFIQRRQNIHVCIISFGSFSGRLLSGIGSDILVAKMNRSRFWCLFASAFMFCVAQVFALTLSNPELLYLVSGVTGIAYGLLFGVYPSLVAHTFGVDGLSTNWGTMTLAPVLTGNIFNLVYGHIYDSHSIVNEHGAKECLQGLQCYRGAYWITLAAGVIGVVVCLWSVWHENQLHKSSEKARWRSDHERTA